MNKEKFETGKKYTFVTKGGSTFEGEFAEFGNIIHDCPGRDYGNYKWDNKKQKWIKFKI